MHPRTVEDEALVHTCRAPRDVVIVQGDDAATFLHSQLAQDIATLSVGSSINSFVLEPTGHLVAVARIFRHVDTVFTLDVDKGHGEAIVSRLQKFVLRAKVTMRMSDWLVQSYWGGDSSVRLAGRAGCTGAWWGSNDTVDVIGAPTHDMPIAASECVQATSDEWHVRRADNEWPAMDHDIEAGDLPATTGLVRVAASFTKGCYPGQELVERMDSRGALAPVEVRSCDVAAHVVGEHVMLGETSIATITSVGTRRALARVKRGANFGRDIGMESTAT